MCDHSGHMDDLRTVERTVRKCPRQAEAPLQEGKFGWQRLGSVGERQHLMLEYLN